MADRKALLAQAEELLEDEKCFDAVQKINACFEVYEPEVGGSGMRILREPVAFLAEVLPKLTPEQRGNLRKMYEVRGDILTLLGAAKRAIIDYGCAETLAPEDADIKAKKQKTEAALSGGEDKEKAERIPVTVLTGFLGSGKTTLLNHILKENHGKRLAIIENEFGEVGIDDALVNGGAILEDENIVSMNNGCICCNVRGDLIAGLKKFIKAAKKDSKPLDGVIIETTGLADPAPVAQTFFADDFVQRHMRLDGILTLVDAKHVIQHLDEEKPEGVENEAVEQIAFADRFLLNKCDLVDEAALVEVERRIRMINKVAPLKRTVNSEVDMNFVMGIKGFSLDRIMEMDTSFLEDSAHEHEHDESVTSVGFDVPGEVDYPKLNEWIGWLLKEKGNDIFRSKGVLAIKGLKEKYVFQAIHMLFTGQPQQPWGQDEVRKCKMVFIGKNLNREELSTGFMACLVK